jgi:hypothetical protein
MRALVKKKTQWKEDLFFTLKFACQKVSKYYSEVIPELGMLLIAAHILDPFWKLQSFRKWDKAMDINPENKGSFTAQYKDAFLKYVEHEYCSKDRIKPNFKLERPNQNDPFSTSLMSGPGHSFDDPYDMSSDDAEYITPVNLVESTPRQSHCAARLLTATTLYLNSPPEAPRRWGQINPNLNDYHTDAMEVSSAFWTPDITDWWQNQEKLNTKYSDLANVARNIFSIMSHRVSVEARFSFGPDVIGWRQSKTTGQTLHEKVVVCQFARSNAGLLAGDIPITHHLDPDNDAEIKKEA